ncbi:MAG: CHAT domain-containing protein, partial [Actinomycetota bacterium]|nr:CHAT domain-containing protein [Actinomycetota bacterium]
IYTVDAGARGAGPFVVGADETGSFTETITLPEALLPRGYVVRATSTGYDDPADAPTATADLTITPVLVMSPSAGAPGDEILASGEYWDPQGGPIRLELVSRDPSIRDGVLAEGVAPVDPDAATAGDLAAFETSFPVPSLEPGPYLIRACQRCDERGHIYALRLFEVLPATVPTSGGAVVPEAPSPPPRSDPQVPASAEGDGVPAWLVPILSALAGVAAAAIATSWWLRRPPRKPSPQRSPEPPGPPPAGSVEARIRCPAVVSQGVEFPFEVGAAAVSAADDPRRPVDVSVQLMTLGFGLKPGESWRRAVRSGGDASAAPFHLTPDVDLRGSHSIDTKFSVAGDVIGIVRRTVSVVERAPDAATERSLVETTESLELPPADASVPDVTITIAKPAGAAEGSYSCTIDTSSREAVLPDAPGAVELGTKAREFARGLIDEVQEVDGTRALERSLVGNGRWIARQLPGFVFEVLRGVHDDPARGGGIMTVLLLLGEPHVPWELAVLEAPLRDDAPAFLSTQAAVARWPIVDRPPPVRRPAEKVEVKSLAFVSGVYDDPRYRRLEFAEREVKTLCERFGTDPIDAEFDPVLDLVSDTSEVDVMHFAIHGRCDPAGAAEGLILTDRRVLRSSQINGTRLCTSPLVFLNACEVGTGREVLGDFSGVAEAFLAAGASAVIAPLWPIDDEVAAQIALGFYERVFDSSANGAEVAHVLRDQRRAFREQPTVATYVAYQFFGHPSYRLFRSEETS